MTASDESQLELRPARPPPVIPLRRGRPHGHLAPVALLGPASAHDFHARPAAASRPSRRQRRLWLALALAATFILTAVEWPVW